MIPIAEAEIDRLIAEDVGFGDLTTRTLGIAGQPGRITFAARDPMVACATEEAARILARLGAVARLCMSSGAAVAPGTLLLEATGNAGALHAGWKVAQTLMEWSAGIASAVRDIRRRSARGRAVDHRRLHAQIGAADPLAVDQGGAGRRRRDASHRARRHDPGVSRTPRVSVG